VVEHSKSFKAQDHINFDISVFFQESFDFIHEHRSQGKNILVHCAAGVSRSSTIVIGYLMTCLQMGFVEAYKFVKKRRYCISPNAGFVTQLRGLELKIKAGEYNLEDGQKRKELEELKLTEKLHQQISKESFFDFQPKRIDTFKISLDAIRGKRK